MWRKSWTISGKTETSRAAEASGKRRKKRTRGRGLMPTILPRRTRALGLSTKGRRTQKVTKRVAQRRRTRSLPLKNLRSLNQTLQRSSQPTKRKKHHIPNLKVRTRKTLPVRTKRKSILLLCSLEYQAGNSKTRSLKTNRKSKRRRNLNRPKVAPKIAMKRITKSTPLLCLPG